MPDNKSRVNSSPPLSADLLEGHGAAFLRLLRIATQIRVDAERALRDAGQDISISEWDALAVATAYEPIRPSDLLRRTVLTATPQTLSSILDRLERRGLIERTADPSDARSVLVSVTEVGRQLVEDVFPTLNRKLILPFNLHFDDEELQQLNLLLARF